jgi:hypothetical protein
VVTIEGGAFGLCRFLVRLGHGSVNRNIEKFGISPAGGENVATEVLTFAPVSPRRDWGGWKVG